MTLNYIKNVSTLTLDSGKCTGCGMCADVCPHGVFTIQGRKASIADRDKCMECGACARNCAWDAISVQSGVGCAAGIINGIIRGSEASCDCGSRGACC